MFFGFPRFFWVVELQKPKKPRKIFFDITCQVNEEKTANIKFFGFSRSKIKKTKN